MLALLALWLTAAQHCGLEAAGLWDSHGAGEAADCCQRTEAEPGCVQDNCDLVERGSFLAGAAVKVPAPQVLEALFVFVLIVEPPRLSAAPPAGIAWAERPHAWVPVWHFARRAAPSPRAPASLLA